MYASLCCSSCKIWSGMRVYVAVVVKYGQVLSRRHLEKYLPHLSVT